MSIFIVVLSLIFANIAPIFSVSAIDNGGDYAEVILRGATNAVIGEENITATYDGGTVSIESVVDPVVEVNNNWNYGDHTGNMWILYTKSESLVFKPTADENKEVNITAGSDGNFSNVSLNEQGYYILSDLITRGNSGPGYEVEFRFENATSSQPQPEDGILAQLHLKCAETGTKECLTAGFDINNGFIAGTSEDDEVYNNEGHYLYNNLKYRYRGEESDETITLGIETLWHEKFVDKVIVNGTEYLISDYIDYSNKEDWYDHYDHQVVRIDLIVQKANDNIYDITFDVARNEHTHIGNFLWTADPDQEFLRDPETGEYLLDENGEKIRGFDYIGHSSLDLVSVYFELGGIAYSCNIDEDYCYEKEIDGDGELMCAISEDENCTIPYVEFESDENLEFDDGSLTIPAGARITMRVIPDYGYQVLNVNMSDLVTTDEGFGEFTFTVPAGAAYFMADVVKTEDAVNIVSEKITTGSIDLGDDQTTLDHGTARLDVTDIELTEDDKEKFDEIAGQDGYDVKSYIDVSLYNITYRGTEDEAWEEKIDDLNEPATITLKLEDGVDGNEIVIVHQKHDGTYEVIPTTYDPETHTITFATSSFSNYAIATRTVGSPETGAFTNNDLLASSTSDAAIKIILIAVLVSSLMILCVPRSIKK